MGQLGASNFNFNFNFANVSSLAGGSGVRANTLDFSKRVDVDVDALIPAKATSMRYPRRWDAELKASIYVNEFLLGYPRWQEALSNEAVIGKSPVELPEGSLRAQILAMLNVAVERERRFLEILQQHEAEGAIQYWLGMLMIDPGRYPATYLLIRVARRLGEHVVMCLKEQFRCPRPSQLCPAIVPMIDPPMTPAFPAGHALQSHLISKCLDAAWPDRADKRFLDVLAQRVAENRVIAGLHFPRDNEAGRDVANRCFEMLRDDKVCPGFNELITRAGTEFAPTGDNE